MGIWFHVIALINATVCIGYLLYAENEINVTNGMAASIQ
jgi:hypothetical protein